MNRLIIFICLLLATACNHHGNNPAATASADVTTNSGQIGSGTSDMSEIAVEFTGDLTTVKLHGHINGIKDAKTYVVEARQGQILSAVIVPATKPGNIRFTKLISPSGKTDGPFDVEMATTLNESGKWRLVIGESNMVGDDYLGNYSLIISLND